MSRLRITPWENSQRTVDDLYADMERRISAAPCGNCPVELTSAFLKLCLAQSCGKCVPCRIGLDRLAALLDQLLDGQGSQADLDTILRTAQSIVDSADCAIGFEAAQMVLDGYVAFQDDYLAHVTQGSCTANFKSVPCVELCPAHVDVPGYISLVGEERYDDAIRLIRKDNPFPSVCGLVCEHPCETHCRRTIVDSPLNIRGIKRFAVDHAGEVPAPPRAPSSGKTVAIVGGGPSGLTAAYFLSLMGHTVTVFERKPKLGGMLRYGIPSYRLPGSYLDRDIDTILSTGVSVRVNCEVGTDVTLEELRRDYDSLYLAIGASLHKGLGIPGEDAKGVLSAIEMLDITIRSVKPDFTGKHVVVVGGGNVAMDATRTAVRLGAASVKCVYRRRVSDMTALPEEIEGAMAEGCEVLPLKAPVRIETNGDGDVTALVVQPQVIGEVRGGRPAPRKADQPEERIACDVVLMAVGQVVDSKSFAQAGVPTDHNNIVTADDGSVPGLEGVFSGGDCVSGPATVILAIEAGKVAAASIDEYLGFHTDISANLDIPPAPFRLKHATGRVDLTEREANWRKNDFELMENCMSEQEMAQECSRCLRCDHYGHAGFKGGRLIKW
ncbi:NAD(P)-binding protein [Evtepia gabavorous]|uniref:NAD(P)-binding protein n=1 Tax=Evtepia gabavorous TaxID=2211183 RepID=UPI000334ACBA|nr:FAD-dependent oxidoreductase [Bacillota bacterium]CCY28001.1 fAD dependent oxidoreductase [Firmicutes bacterium CAG:114]